MKLKEKLAEEYIETHDSYLEWFKPIGRADLAYIAGFEKAREMAQKRFIDRAMVRPKDKEEPFTLNTVVINRERFEISLLEDLQTLGEEDV